MPNLSQTSFLRRSKIPASGDRHCPECQYGNAREAQICSLCGVNLAEAEAARRSAHRPQAPQREDRSTVLRTILGRDEFEKRRRSRHADVALVGFLAVFALGVVLDVVFDGAAGILGGFPRHLVTGLLLGAPLGLVTSYFRMGPLTGSVAGTLVFAGVLPLVSQGENPLVLASAACLGLCSGWICGTQNSTVS